MYEPNTSNSVIICPYDNNHTISKLRIQRHIVKCEKNYPDNYKVTCPYNATHRLFKSEVMEHIIKCPMRTLIEPELYQSTRKCGSVRFKLESCNTSTIDWGENWDDEFDPNETDASEVLPSDLLEDNRPRPNLSDLEDKAIRPPRGYAEALMLEGSEKVEIEDMESVVSAMAIGRGTIRKNAHLLKAIGRGRGHH